MDKTILVAGMDNTIQSFYLKGKKNFSVQMPSEILALQRMDTNRAERAQNILIALKSGEIRIYNGKNIIDKLQTDDICCGMIFGVFGREEGCLVVNMKGGGLQAKILQRQAKL
jgi:Bardet-Biedl syndrome 1 protein